LLQNPHNEVLKYCRYSITTNSNHKIPTAHAASGPKVAPTSVS
jgi:hypothetical protein